MSTIPNTGSGGPPPFALILSAYAQAWLSARSSGRNSAHTQQYESALNKALSFYFSSAPNQELFRKFLETTALAVISKYGEGIKDDEFMSAFMSFDLTDITEKLHGLDKAGMDIAEEQELISEAQLLADEKACLQTQSTTGKSYAEVAMDLNAASKKRRRIESTPVFNWADECEKEATEHPFSNFFNTVKTVKRSMMGLSLNNSVVIPKNFDAVFGSMATMIRALMSTLKIEIIESSVTLDPSVLVWTKLFSPHSEEDMAQFRALDQNKRLGTAVLNLLEAFEYISRPSYIEDSRPGINYVRFLMCEAHQELYQNSASSVEAAFKYVSKSKKDFEDCIAPLIPNWSEMSVCFSTMLKRIVQGIFSSPAAEKMRLALNGLIEHFYVNDRALIARTFNVAAKRRLNAEGKRAFSRKEKLHERHYETYRSVVKPSVDTEKKLVSAEELVVIKKINLQLQTLETHCELPTNPDQKHRRSDARDLIQLYHEKCRNIEKLFAARKQQTHKLLKQQRADAIKELGLSQKDIEEDRKKPFSIEEWKTASNKVLEDDDDLVFTALAREFRLENNVINFKLINENFFRRH